MKKTNNEKLLTFPCQFPLKAIGLNTEELLPEICKTIKHYTPSFNPENIKSNPSKNGKYLAITATFLAESQAQLDAIYLALNASDLIKMTL